MPDMDTLYCTNKCTLSISQFILNAGTLAKNGNVIII